MKDIIQYISCYLPPFIEVEGNYEYTGSGINEKDSGLQIETFIFRMFLNHPHYDFRIGYILDDDSIYYINGEKRQQHLYLYEGISNEEQLKECLISIHDKLLNDNLLDEDYASEEGYILKKSQ